jgi:outer membrane phospholipase A
MLYIPSYVAITIVFAIFSYSYEKSKRKNFEFETAALSKEKVWKDILRELPEGIIVTS